MKQLLLLVLPLLVGGCENGEIHVAAGREAYQGLMPDLFLKSLKVEQKAETWRRGLEKPSPGTTLVCERSGDIVLSAVKRFVT